MILATNKTIIFKNYCIKKKINFIFLKTKEIQNITNFKSFFFYNKKT